MCVRGLIMSQPSISSPNPTLDARSNARQPSISSLNPTPAGGGIHKNWVPNLQDVYRKEKAKKSANKTFTKRNEFGELHSQKKMAWEGLWRRFRRFMTIRGLRVQLDSTRTRLLRVHDQTEHNMFSFTLRRIICVLLFFILYVFSCVFMCFHVFSCVFMCFRVFSCVSMCLCVSCQDPSGCVLTHMSSHLV